MNDHFKKFYSHEDQRAQAAGSHAGSPDEIRVKIEKLNKKLNTYEDRKRGILFSQAKETQESVDTTAAATAATTTDPNHSNINNNNNPVDLVNNKKGSNTNLNGAASSSSSNGAGGFISSTTSANNFPPLVGQPQQQQQQLNPLVATSSLPLKQTLTAAHRTASFTVNNLNKIANGDAVATAAANAAAAAINTLGVEEKPQFFLNQDASFKTYNQQNGDLYSNSDDQLDPTMTAFLANYKALQNMVCVLNVFCFLNFYSF